MQSTPTHPRKRQPRSPWLVALLLIILVVASACSSDQSDSTTESVDDSAAEDSGDEGGENALGLAATDAAMDQEAGEDGDAMEEDVAAASAGEAGAEAPAEDSSPDQPEISPTGPPTASTGERIIKEGTVTVEIEPGDFDASFSQIVSRAQALGGHVSGTSSSTDVVGPDEEILVSGQVTIRIPVQNFEDLLTSLGDAGEIIDRNVTSQDVTAEFTDLESRRRNLQAQERFYLGLLEEAAAIPDAIAVQQQLDGIQSQIEQITGRLNLLGDRTAFSTLTVRLNERGATPVEEEVIEEPGGLAPYIDQAIDTFFTTVGALIVFLTFIAPFLVLAFIGYLIWRGVAGRRRSTTPEPTPGANLPYGGRGRGPGGPGGSGGSGGSGPSGSRPGEPGPGRSGSGPGGPESGTGPGSDGPAREPVDA